MVVINLINRRRFVGQATAASLLTLFPHQLLRAANSRKPLRKAMIVKEVTERPWSP